MPGRRLIVVGTLLLLLGGAVGIAAFVASQAAGPAAVVSGEMASTRSTLLAGVFAGTLIAVLGAVVLSWGLARRTRAALPGVQRAMTDAGRRAGDASRRGRAGLEPHVRIAVGRVAEARDRSADGVAAATTRVGGALQPPPPPPPSPPALLPASADAVLPPPPPAPPAPPGASR